MELQGKIVLITGSTSGIGRETAIEMARRGAELVLPVRDSLKGDILKDEILQQVPKAQLHFFHCNLASFDSIKEFVLQFIEKFDELHILINNAGIWETKRNTSQDGIEMNFAVNHLAPYLLTNLLLDQMQKSSPARIVNVASEAHRQGKINFDDIEGSNSWSSLKSYGQSKLANILFTKKLAQNLKGSGITVNCLHPGVVSTRLFDKMPRFLMKMANLFMISPVKGAQTTIYLATSPEVENVTGEYFAKSKIKKPAGFAIRQDFADKLWAISKQYTGVG